MKKFLAYLILLFTWVVPSDVAAQILLDYNTRGGTASTQLPIPTRDIEVLSDGNIKVTYTFSSALICPDNLFPDSYSWHIGGFGLNTKPEEPAIPIKIDSFEIPDGMTASVSISNVEYVPFSYKLAPAREPLPAIDGACYTASDVKPVAISQNPVPISAVKTNGVYDYRGVKFIDVLVYPVLYTPSTQWINAVKKLTYLVKFSPSISKTQMRATTTHSLTLCPDDAFVYNTPSTPTSPKPEVDINNNKFTTTALSVDKTYAILTTNALKNAVDSFAEWKRSQGYNVVIKTAPSWTYETAKATIDAMFVEYPNFYHLLIIGDVNTIPGNKIYSSLDNYAASNIFLEYHYSDYYYSIYGTSEYMLPAISVGRIPSSDINTVADILYKITSIEKRPTNISPKLVGITYFQDNDRNSYEDLRFTMTTEEIIDYISKNTSFEYERIYATPSNVNPLYWNNNLFNYGEPIPSHLKKPTFQWNGSANGIQTSINNGTSLLVYNAHGSPTSWGSLNFYTTHLSQLSNNVQPFVLSIACLTGRYNLNNSFALEFLKTRNNRCCGIIAASSLSYTGVNDAFIESFIDALWPTPGLLPHFRVKTGKPSSTPIGLSTIGDLFNQSNKRTSEIFNTTWKNSFIHNREVYHIFGDPSMFIHTEPIVDAHTFTTIERSEPSKNNSDELSHYGYVKIKLDRNAYIGLYNKTTGEAKRYYGRYVYQFADIGDDWIASVYDANVRPLISANLDINPILPEYPSLKSVNYIQSDNQCRITLESDDNTVIEPCSLEVRDSFGKLIKHEECSTETQYNISIPTQSKGVHIVSLVVNGSIVESKHFIK